VLRRHLAEPIPGVYALDRELLLYLRSHAGAAETQLAFEEAERRRAAGQTYTMDDYLTENRPHSKDLHPCMAVDREGAVAKATRGINGAHGARLMEAGLLLLV
jgi:hypothetical protein